MSRGFVKEGDQIEAPLHVPRAPLAAGVVNYVRPQGLAALQAELADLQTDHAAAEASQAEPQVRSARLLSLNARIAELEARIGSARVVPPAMGKAARQVRFGATVRIGTVLDGKPMLERTFTIVGVDEADAAKGLIAFTAPIAQALQGLAAGKTATLKTGRGLEQLTVLEVRYG